jgi:hypothetical protein
MNEKNDDTSHEKEQFIENLSEGFPLELWTYKGKPLRILSTSLGLVLVANMLFAPAVYGETASPTPSTSAANQPKLTEWSSEAVKKYYDPNVDWNIPLPVEDKKGQSNTSGSTNTNTNGNSNSTVIVNNGGGGFGGGIGFTELLLFHMMFNRGGYYSSSQWYDRRPVFDPGTSRPYQAKSFNSDTFQNRPTAGSTVRPSTSQKSGTFSTNSSSSSKSTSSSKGSIGGNSSGFSSSSKSSGGSSSSGG